MAHIASMSIQNYLETEDLHGQALVTNQMKLLPLSMYVFVGSHHLLIEKLESWIPRKSEIVKALITIFR